MAPKAPKKRKDDGEPELSLECAHAKKGHFYFCSTESLLLLSFSAVTVIGQ